MVGKGGKGCVSGLVCGVIKFVGLSRLFLGCFGRFQVWGSARLRRIYECVDIEQLLKGPCSALNWGGGGFLREGCSLGKLREP